MDKNTPKKSTTTATNAAASTPAATKPAPNTPVKKTSTTAAKPTVSKPVAAKPAPTAKARVAKPVTAKVETTANMVSIVVESKKDDKKHKPEKVKMERDSFTMPKDEYALLTQLKMRLNAMGHPVKKSELLRAGVKLLASMNDASLKETMLAVPVIKTGRPKK
ncbi:MAG: hypothetical protein WC733_06805 [Methylophilus sp.]